MRLETKREIAWLMQAEVLSNMQTDCSQPQDRMSVDVEVDNVDTFNI